MLGGKIQQLVGGRNGNDNDNDKHDDDDDQEERNLIYSSMTMNKKQPYVDPNEVNRLLVTELNQLSLDNREKVMEEIHGVMITTTTSTTTDTTTATATATATATNRGTGSRNNNNNDDDDNDDRSNVNVNNNDNNDTKSNAGSCGDNNDSKKKTIDEEENKLLQQMEYEIEKIITANFATADAAFAAANNNNSNNNNPPPSHHQHQHQQQHQQQQQQAGGGSGSGSNITSTATSGSAGCILGTAYQKAKLYQSELIYDRNFRYSFLLKEEMDPKKAAVRILRYLDFIVTVYHTDEVLFRPIMLQDLSENSKQLLYKEGPLQLLPIRDPSGRKVLVHLRDLGPHHDMNTKQQVGSYMGQTSVEDREGAIMVYFLHHSNHKIPDLNELRMVNALFKTIPAKFSALHLCCPNIPLYDIVKAAVILHVGKELRLRLRLHVGSYTECKYSLKSFGIAVDRLPLNLELWKWSHNVDMKYYRKWLKMRQAKENAIIIRAATTVNNNNSNNNIGGSGGVGVGVMSAVHHIRSNLIETPHHEDVLFGKGSSAMSHPGNVAMRRLLEERYERYEEITASSLTRIPVTVTTNNKDNNTTTTTTTTNNTLNHKEQLVAEIISEIKREMGRFLKEDDDYHGLFIEVDNTVARKKIGIAFRDLKKRKLRTHQQQQQQQQQQTLPIPLTFLPLPSSSNINRRNDEKRQGEKRAATSSVTSLSSYGTTTNNNNNNNTSNSISNEHSYKSAQNAGTAVSIFDVSPTKLHQRRKLCHQCFGGGGASTTT